MALRLVTWFALLLGAVLLGHVRPSTHTAVSARHNATACFSAHANGHAETRADALVEGDDDDDGDSDDDDDDDDDATPGETARESQREGIATRERALAPVLDALGPSSGHGRETEHPPRG